MQFSHGMARVLSAKMGPGTAIRIEGMSSSGGSEAEINVMFGALRHPGSPAHWVILDGWMWSNYEGLKPQEVELKLLKLMSLFIFADFSH